MVELFENAGQEDERTELPEYLGDDDVATVRAWNPADSDPDALHQSTGETESGRQGPALRIVGRGVEHEVWQPLKHPRLVIKRTRENISKLNNWDRVHYANEERTRKFRTRLLRKEALGKEANKVVVRQKAWARQKSGTERYDVQTFQWYVPEKNMPHLQMRGGYGERAVKDETLEPYQMLNEVLVQGLDPERFNVSDLLSIHESLKDLVQEADTDPALHAYLCIIVREMIEHSMETGDIFDLFGNENIIFFKDAGTGRYTARFIDGLHSDVGMVRFAQKALEHYCAGEGVADFEVSPLLNVLNYARIINGLATVLGIKERFDFLPESLKDAGSRIDFRGLPDQLLWSKREQQDGQAA